jgi:hypothetical protein
VDGLHEDSARGQAGGRLPAAGPAAGHPAVVLAAAHDRTDEVRPNHVDGAHDHGHPHDQCADHYPADHHAANDNIGAPDHLVTSDHVFAADNYRAAAYDDDDDTANPADLSALEGASGSRCFHPLAAR